MFTFRAPEVRFEFEFSRGYGAVDLFRGWRVVLGRRTDICSGVREWAIGPLTVFVCDDPEAVVA